MSTCCLGDSFDIHGGGNDLEFPHHENEIAQSEAATGKPYAKSWLHCGMITINGEKMSKSLGNFFTIREVLEKYHPEVMRYLLIASHYRSPINYSEENLREAKAALDRFYNALKGLPEAAPAEAAEYVERFAAAMDDDFNTAGACSVLFELAREVNRLRESDLSAAAALAARLKQLAGLLGVLQLEPEAFLQAGAGRGRGADPGAPGGAGGEELGGVRPDSRPAHRHGRGAGGWQGRHYLAPGRLNPQR
jgi:cysteinyl-tRNA synthetase